ncbi:hypothetical protein ACFFX1_39535 [Dactylosporangium sucinum]|uniref:Uncharacterized protein n=1 Tax=Dactylosporangium sucinum TaxID=1424081 RepID=A0A917SXR6_9ACTN|nr:hypothetical protein [Dactylosporangium sucinum]GGM02991.1 hypothetical protein GCM10007977_000470 [Dactylosporangium sucinum]
MNRTLLRRLGVAVAGTLVVAGLVAPPAAAAPAANQAVAGTVENLGIPISDYLILDSVQGRDKHGNPMLYGSTYVASSPGVTFFAVDARTGTLVKQLTMTGSWGGYHTVLGTDGRVYLATQSGDGLAHLWRYDPKTEQLGIVATSPETGIGHTFFFGITAAPWGKLYLGTYPSGKVFEYDQETSALRDLGVVVPDHLYAKALVPLPGKRLFVGGGTPAFATILDVKNGKKTDILPSQYAGYSFGYNASVVGNDLLVQMVTPDIRVLRFNLNTPPWQKPTFLGEVPQLAGYTVLPRSGREAWAVGTCTGSTSGVIRYNLATKACTRISDADWVSGHLSELRIGGEQWLTGIGSKGVYGRVNPRTGEVVRQQLTLPGSPTTITALETGPDGKIYGGTYETNALFRTDPGTGATTVLGPVAKGRTGEILSMTSTSDKLFMGSYTFNVVTAYDPAQPWNPDSAAGGNPRDLGQFGDQQYRPWDFVKGSTGKLYLASGAAYGQLGGALTRIDPATYQSQSWRHLAGDHNLFALAAGQGEIYVGSTTHGDGVTATGDAKLLVFDEASSSVVHSTVPVPGSTWIFSLATGGNGKVYGVTSDGKWFSFAPATRAVTQLGAFPLGSPLALATGPDGLVYGTTGGSLFRIDPATDSLTTLANVGGSYYRTIAFDSSGRVYWGSGASLMRWTP